MRHRITGRTDLQLPVVTFGAWALGGIPFVDGDLIDLECAVSNLGTDTTPINPNLASVISTDESSPASSLAESSDALS